jgi:hypothetical protein
VAFVGFDELERGSLFSFYPNPASSNLTIETDKPREIILMNLVGEVLIRERIDQKGTINLHGLAKGIYLLSDADKNNIRKLSIQ